MKNIIAKTTLASVVLGVLFALPAQAKSLGEELSYDRKKGNCIACHFMVGGNLPGNVAPALVAMKARFPDKSILKAQIYDATVKNKNTLMPPFGKHNILSAKEVNAVTDYIYTL